MKKTFLKIILVFGLSVIDFDSLLAPNDLYPLLNVCVNEQFLPTLKVKKDFYADYSSAELQAALTNKENPERKTIVDKFASILIYAMMPCPSGAVRFSHDRYLTFLAGCQGKGKNDLLTENMSNVLLGHSPGTINEGQGNDFTLKGACSIFFIDKLVDIYFERDIPLTSWDLIKGKNIPDRKKASEDEIDALIVYLQNGNLHTLIDSLFGPDGFNYQALAQFVNSSLCKKLTATVYDPRYSGSDAVKKNQKKVWMAGKFVEAYPTLWQAKRCIIPGITLLTGLLALGMGSGKLFIKNRNIKVSEKRRVANGGKIEVKSEKKDSKVSRKRRAINRATKNCLIFGGVMLTGFGLINLYKVGRSNPSTAFGFKDLKRYLLPF